MGGRRDFLIAAAIVSFHLSDAFGLGPDNVLVLYNLASPDGTQIANYYAQAHPGVHLLGISGVDTSENITADQYLSTIRPQVMSALSPTTDVIVTTKGMPLKVTVTEPEPAATFPNLPTYTDPSGNTRSILSWKPVSSLESELTSIATVASWQMMGDQSVWLSNHFTANPYFKVNAPFDPATYNMHLSARLDGFNVSDVTAAIDRAQHAFIGPQQSPSGPYHFIVDNDPTKSYAPTMARLVNNVLTPAGLPVTADNTTAFVSSTTGPLIGYVSHGANQASTPPNYISAGLNVTLANGAIFDTWESYNASTFVQGANHGNQGLVGDWLHKGGTAGVGNVDEPGANPSSVTNEDQLFGMMISGHTFAEAAWSATQQLSYVNTVVGDPLMTWKTLLPGDSNMDGRVDIADLASLGAHWGAHVQSGGSSWGLGDFNSDGVVDIADLSILGANWNTVAAWANGTPNAGGLSQADLGPALEQLLAPQAIPEPSTFVIMAAGAFGLLVFRRFLQRRPIASRLPSLGR